MGKHDPQNLTLPAFITLENIQWLYVEMTRPMWRTETGPFDEKAIADLVTESWNEATQVQRMNMFSNYMNAYNTISNRGGNK